jgi:hypothetical protein
MTQNDNHGIKRVEIIVINSKTSKGGNFSMSHRHKSIRFDKSYQKKQSRIKEKQELRKEVRQVENSQEEQEQKL